MDGVADGTEQPQQELTTTQQEVIAAIHAAFAVQTRTLVVSQFGSMVALAAILVRLD